MGEFALIRSYDVSENIKELLCRLNMACIDVFAADQTWCCSRCGEVQSPKTIRVWIVLMN